MSEGITGSISHQDIYCKEHWEELYEKYGYKGQRRYTKPEERITIDQLMQSIRTLGADADMAFVVFAMQIQRMDQRVAEQIKSIQQTSKLRDAINDRINTLRELRAKINKDGEGDTGEKRYGPMKLAKAFGYDGPDPLVPPSSTLENGDPKDPEMLQAEMAAYEVNRSRYQRAVDKAGEVLAKYDYTLTPEGKIDTDQLGRIDDGGGVTAEQIEAEEKRLESQIQQLDSNRELAMISLNSNINKKGQYVEWLSNILKKSHDTKSSVIGNLR